VRKDLLVEAHGSFATASCVECSEKHTHEFVREKVFVDELPHCTKCQKGLVKPDIVFFGEALPQRFHMYVLNTIVFPSTLQFLVPSV